MNYPEYKAYSNPHATTAPTIDTSLCNGKLIPTGSDIEGPFYTPNAPYGSALTLTPTNTLRGVVTDVDGNLLEDVVLDVWQANAAGEYDNVGFNFRRKVMTKQDGNYVLHTIVPGDYDISNPNDPQPHEFRCAHIHFKLSKTGYKSLTTQLYFPNDKHNPTDHWFNKDRVVDTTGGLVWKFNFVLEKQ